MKLATQFLLIMWTALCCPTAQPAEKDTWPIGEKGFWDGLDTVTYEVTVSDAATKERVDGALVTLVVVRLSEAARVPHDTDFLTAKTVYGAATVKGFFQAGGEYIIGKKGSSSHVLVWKSFIRCEAVGYKPKDTLLAPELHFKPNQPRTVKVDIRLEPK